MSDYASELPIRSQLPGQVAPDDVIVKIGDGTSPTTQLLAVDGSGRITIKLDDGNGNPVTSQANGAQQALDVGIDVGGVQIDPRQIRALTSADVVTVDQGTSPWIVKDLADGSPTGGTAGTFSQLAGGIFTTATGLSTPLTAGQQAALQFNANGLLLTEAIFSNDTNYGTVGANTLRTAAQIGNATGAADFNFGTVGAQTLRAAAQIGNATGAADFGAGATDAQTLRTSANQGAPNTAANAWPISITAGGALNSPTNPVFVSSSDVAGTSIDNYQTSAALAANASATQDYTVSALKTFYTKQIWATASGKIKVQVEYETAALSGIFNTFWVAFNSTSETNILIPVPTAKTQATGARVRIIITNLDKAAMDVYSTLSGTEQ